MDLEALQGKRILITGATGLIGKAIVKRLTDYNRNADDPIRILASVRNLQKAENMFPAEYYPGLEFLEGDIKELKAQDLDVHYIIHGASLTSSKMFVSQPVEIIMTAILGTRRVLEFAKVNPVDSFVFLSTMEIYGAPQQNTKINETFPNNIDSMNVRSSYPESKRMCENLCAAYLKEYGVPTKVVRLTQTFGNGVDYNDQRVFAEFARCVLEKKDIVLKTKGRTKRSYLFTDDAADAILTVLLNGANGEAYNAANEDTYCSILEMAELVAEHFGGPNTKVRIEEDNIEQLGYAPQLYMDLDTQKLRNLGWKPQKGLAEMYQEMLIDMKKSSQSQ